MKKPVPQKPLTVDSYIEGFPNEVQERLQAMRRTIKASAKGATESIKWSMPAYSYDRILVMFAGFKHHIGLYPTPSAIIAFQKELEEYPTAKGSIQFPYTKKLPLTLIKKIVTYRVKESIAKDTKWKGK